MGRWGFGPLDSDDALNAVDLFMDLIEDEDSFYLEMDFEEVSERLGKLTLKDIETLIEKDTYGILSNNTYVIPLKYVEYGVHPTDKKLLDFLLRSLDHHKCLIGIPQSMNYIRLFENNFDSIMSGKSTIEKGKLVNLFEKDNNDTFLIEDNVLKKYTGKDTVIVIPDGVKTIGKRVFSNKTKITSVRLPDSLEVISEQAFYGCKKLKEINFPLSLKKIEYAAFSDCESLSSAILPDGISSIGGDCFSRDINLTKVHLPNGLTKINDYTFDGCANLSEVNIPNKVTYIGENTFRGCKYLQNVKLPDCLEELGYCAFKNCDIKEIRINSCVKLDNTCSHFSENKNINIIFDEKRTDFSFENGVLYNRDKTKLIKNISNNDETFYVPEGVLEISNLAFWHSPNKKIVFSKTVKKVNKLFCCMGDDEFPSELVFDDGIHFSCSPIDMSNYSIEHNFKKAVLPKHFTYDGEFPFLHFVDVCDFSECEDYKLIDGLVLNKDKTIIIASNKNIEGVINIPDTVVEIKDHVFSKCRASKILLPENIKKLGNGCFFNSSIKNIFIPKSISIIPPYAFAYCTKLENVIMHNQIKGIGENAFFESGLVSVKIPGTVKIVEKYSFAGCKNLEKVVIEEGTEIIKENAFLSDNSLKEVIIPSSMQNIKEDAFFDSLINCSIELPETTKIYKSFDKTTTVKR